MTQPAQNAQSVDDRMTFPPFPVPPPGVIIIPFKSFVENGIRMFPTDGDDTERDGLGLPTIPMMKKHDADRCKTETRRKRKQTQRKAPLPPGARREWYDHWDEGEDLRIGGPFNPHMSPIDRFYEAAAQFKKGRTWPQSSNNKGSLAGLFEQFKFSIGLRSVTPVWTRTDQQQKDDESESESDDEDAFEKEVIETSRPPPFRQQHKTPLARPPYALWGKDPVPVGSEAEVKDLIDEETARREEVLVDFLDDPEEKIKKFLSSYIRKQGLIWYDRNLIFIPKLVGFFLNYILRSDVFRPEPAIEKGFRKAVEVVALAEKELILTSKVSKELPDKVAHCMKALWGQKANGYQVIEPSDDGANADSESTADDEPEAKRQKLDEQLKDADVNLIDTDELVKEGQLREAISDNVDPNVAASINTSTPDWASTGWGDGGGGLPASEAWIAVAPAPSPEENEWTTSSVVWEPPEAHSLLPLLGPTALPLTHTTGIAEWSLRRIKSFTPPSEPATLPKSALSSGPSPDAVEIELERRFAKVVMEPWMGWDKAQEELPHLTNPRILRASRGLVNGIVDEEGYITPLPADAVAAPVDPNGLKPHDPSKDEITVLVDPKALPAFCEGLGIGATWVQIAREQDFAVEDGKKKKKKGKKTARYWYVEEVLMVIPSYHT